MSQFIKKKIENRFSNKKESPLIHGCYTYVYVCYFNIVTVSKSNQQCMNENVNIPGNWWSMRQLEKFAIKLPF